MNFKGFDAGKESVAEPNPTDLFKIFLGSEDKEDHQLADGRVIFLATNGLKPSLDLEKNGMFTHAVLAALKGAADKEGYEPDGLVTVDELVTYLEKEISRAGPQERQDQGREGADSSRPRRSQPITSS